MSVEYGGPLDLLRSILATPFDGANQSELPDPILAALLGGVLCLGVMIVFWVTWQSSLRYMLQSMLLGAAGARGNYVRQSKEQERIEMHVSGYPIEIEEEEGKPIGLPFNNPKY